MGVDVDQSEIRYSGSLPEPSCSDVRIRVNHSIRKGIAILIEAKTCADDLGVSRWQFAVERAELERLGMSTTELRWLVGRGYIAHAAETTTADAHERQFAVQHSTRFVRDTCFVLTSAGEGLGPQFLRSPEEAAIATTQEPTGWPSKPTPPTSSPLAAVTGSPGVTQAPDASPCWDPIRRLLTLDGHVIKHFRVPAPIQECVLDAFAEEHWATHVDDPIPPSANIDPKRRVQSVIMSLNRNQQKPLLRFRGNGCGTGIVWERVDARAE